MQRLGGLLLMLAGVSLGAYTFLPPPIDGKEALRQVTRISAAPDRSAAEDTATVAAVSAATDAQPAPVISKPASTWSAIVTAESSAQGSMRSLKPGDDGARAQLARDLQTELKRVGCYNGEVTGNWTPSTRRAMSSFMDRVNATLPIDEPDYILLTLVQGHAELACGASCPAGQSMGDAGRCLPNAVLARNARKSQREEDTAAAEAKKSEEQRVAAEREAAERLRLAEEKRTEERARLKALDDARRLAAAKAAAAKAAEVAANTRKSGETSTAIVAEAGQEQLPWLNDDLSVPAPQRAERPAGMMSVGGPQQVAKAEITDSAAAVTPDAGPRPIDLAPQPLDKSEIDSRPAVQGLPGSKSGVAARGLPGSKSGVAVRGLPGSKSGVAARKRQALAAIDKQYYDAGPVYRAPKKFAAPRRSGPPVAGFKPLPPKTKFASSKASKRQLARPGSNAFHMLSAMGGVF